MATPEEHEHDWHWWAARGMQWQSCGCGAGRDHVTKEPIQMGLNRFYSDPPDGRPDSLVPWPAKLLTETGP